MKTLFKEIFIVVTLAIAALAFIQLDPMKGRMPADPTGLTMAERHSFFGLFIKKEQ